MKLLLFMLGIFKRAFQYRLYCVYGHKSYLSICLEFQAKIVLTFPKIKVKSLFSEYFTLLVFVWGLILSLNNKKYQVFFLHALVNDHLIFFYFPDWKAVQDFIP